MPPKERSQQPMPPPNLSVEEQAEWWRNNGAGMNKIKTLSDRERICPRCGSPQPCTGTSECTVCSNSLAGAKRKKLDLFEPQ